ncbi:PA3371 family protein [Pseudomonas cannabina]|uniref:Uncharacterized protein n=3 Tax=Pseudomonas syringae group TaxID=136849 RepID=A0A3M3PSZ9_PSECA|nr:MULTISPECIES: PA3371 family protein [Pseudomonas syringae group]KPB78013.1 Uncharacterized protein AC507_1033 [Pseudomonas syringae pv. maculicola]KPW21981.1 hypothetical protein ALO83_101638 [Pseudomonas cannabina pv. alisalensis]MBM0142456.1 hypothetical protein [Pseudomonas cannabina pv. alisalensis]QHE98330.1 hypothetical protein PMA4326_018155 [Pseudomonas syringae pv. maculicola str. ES4326]QQN23396.1 hypothetical protein JGS08_07075 [Pseudomonas cannabina pv. alisalensis]
MSKTAVSFLVLTVMALVVDFLLPPQAQAVSVVTTIVASLFAGLFVVALFVGRRFKFDPVLR